MRLHYNTPIEKACCFNLFCNIVLLGPETIIEKLIPLSDLQCLFWLVFVLLFIARGHRNEQSVVLLLADMQYQVTDIRGCTLFSPSLLASEDGKINMFFFVLG